MTQKLVATCPLPYHKQPEGRYEPPGSGFPFFCCSLGLSAPEHIFLHFLLPADHIALLFLLVLAFPSTGFRVQGDQACRHKSCRRGDRPVRRHQSSAPTLSSRSSPLRLHSTAPDRCRVQDDRTYSVSQDLPLSVLAITPLRLLSVIYALPLPNAY